MAKSTACCPHCSGTSGFTYEMRVVHHMIGRWGTEAECGDSGHTSDSLARCLECGAKLRAATAEGRIASQRATPTAETVKEAGQ